MNHNIICQNSNAYKEYISINYPKTQLTMSNKVIQSGIFSNFKIVEILDIYLNTIQGKVDNLITLKLNELKHQMMLQLFHLPNYSTFVFSSLKRSISEIILKITLLALTEPSNDIYTTINKMMFSNLKSQIKSLPFYTDNQLFKKWIDVFFSFYGESSNDIHLKNGLSSVEYLQSFNRELAFSEIKEFENLNSKVEMYLLEIFPKEIGINDLELTFSSKLQLKKIITPKEYKKYFSV